MKLRKSKQKPYGYRPAYLKTWDGEHDPNYVNTPSLHTGFAGIDGPPPKDKRLKRLTKQFRTGKISCRKATVAMFWIRPQTDYRPHITDTFRQYIELLDSYGENYRKGPIPIILYEHKGQLVMAADYKTYWLHRIDESWTVDALILGDFTERDFCRGLGESFTVDSLDLNVTDELMDSDTRRLALLLRNEPLRIETKKQLEAINMKDLQDALKEPVPYEPEWTKSKNKLVEDTNLVLTPSLLTGHFFGHAPTDERFIENAAKAMAGELDCQLATVAMAMMRPYSDYHPTIPIELRNEFMERYETSDELPITIYEYEPGHFMVSGGEGNLATYELFREQQPLDARCIILGPYTKTWAVSTIGKPFQSTLTKQAGYNPDETTMQIGKKLLEIMRTKGTSLSELSWLTGIAIEDICDMTDDFHPQAPSIEQLEQITRILGVRASDIVPF